MLELLGSGSSAAGGYWWFLVGRDRQKAYWVAKQDWAEPGDPSGYEVRTFTAGTPFESSPPASDREIEEVLDFASALAPGNDLPWGDAARAAELYEAYTRR
jgi:hypothetical protein